MLEFINRDTEGKIIELQKKRESQIKKVEHIITRGEMSMGDIRERIYQAQMEIRQQKEVSYDVLPDNETKVWHLEFLSCTRLFFYLASLCFAFIYLIQYLHY